ELEEEKVQELLPSLSTEHVTEILQRLPHNEAADVAADLPIERRGEALAGMRADDSAKVTALMRYPQDTAGGIMSDRFITLRADQTIQAAQEMLRARAEQLAGDVSYLYVTDAEQRLLGVVSLRDLVFRKPDRRLDEIMDRDVKFLW